MKFFLLFNYCTFQTLMTLKTFSLENVVTGLDFHPDGEMIATIDRYGMCLISEVNTSKCNFHMNMNINGEAGKLTL